MLNFNRGIVDGQRQERLTCKRKFNWNGEFVAKQYANDISYILYWKDLKILPIENPIV
jgi:hypothetical protein